MRRTHHTFYIWDPMRERQSFSKISFMHVLVISCTSDCHGRWTKMYEICHSAQLVPQQKNRPKPMYNHFDVRLGLTR